MELNVDQTQLLVDITERKLNYLTLFNELLEHRQRVHMSLIIYSSFVSGVLCHVILHPKQSCLQLKRPTMSKCRYKKSPTPVSNPVTRWSSVIRATASTWPAVCCTAVTQYPKTSTLPQQPLKPNDPSSLSTGAQRASKWASTTSPLPLSPVIRLSSVLNNK